MHEEDVHRVRHFEIEDEHERGSLSFARPALRARAPSLAPRIFGLLFEIETTDLSDLLTLGARLSGLGARDSSQHTQVTATAVHPLMTTVARCSWDEAWTRVKSVYG